MNLQRHGSDARLEGFLLAGDISAEAWVAPLLQDQLPAKAFGRLLLVPGAKAPATLVARGKQVCSCFDVSQDQIDSVLAEASGAPDTQLAQLQERLQCGTNCGSCLPELKRIVRLHRRSRSRPTARSRSQRAGTGSQIRRTNVPSVHRTGPEIAKPSAQRHASMSIATYIREIGRGKEGARSLTQPQAYDLFCQVLDGHVTDLEIGAFALAMRIKGESIAELAGFLPGHARTLHRPAPSTARASSCPPTTARASCPT